MILNLYYTIIGLFIIGAILLVIIHQKRPSINQKNNWTKYGTYVFIINAVLATVIFFPDFFIYLAIIILFFSWYELIRLFFKTGKKKVFLLIIPVFILLSFTFIRFSFLPGDWMLMAVFVVSIFDAFSQLSGQLLGNTRILPKISPNKTLEGSIGGLLFALVFAGYIGKAISLPLVSSIVIGFAIAVFGFIGDLLASALKRRTGVKDFSQLLPGHGGFLDRFDSLIFTSLLMYLLTIIKFI